MATPLSAVECNLTVQALGQAPFKDLKPTDSCPKCTHPVMDHEDQAVKAAKTKVWWMQGTLPQWRRDFGAAEYVFSRAGHCSAITNAKGKGITRVKGFLDVNIPVGSWTTRAFVDSKTTPRRVQSLATVLSHGQIQRCTYGVSASSASPRLER